MGCGISSRTKLTDASTTGIALTPAVVAAAAAKRAVTRREIGDLILYFSLSNGEEVCRLCVCVKASRGGGKG